MDWKTPDYTEAERLLGRSILPRVIEAVREEIIDEWRRADTHEGREALHAQDAGLTRIEGYLEGMVADLAHAAEEAEAED